MKPLKQVAEAYMALSEGERQFRAGAYMEAAESYKNAMAASRFIPPEEVFDHVGFGAFCHAGLSGAFGKLGNYEESLISADIALRYFNRRGELNQDEGKLWIAAVFNRAVAMEMTGHPAEALKAFRTAGEMIAERKEVMEGGLELKSAIDESIAKLQTLVPAPKPGYRAWWEFWS